MIELFFYHALGILCLLGIISYGLIIIRAIRQSEIKITLLSIGSGIVYFCIAFSVFLLIMLRTNILLYDSIVNYTSITARIYLSIFFIFCTTLIVSFINKFIFKDKINNIIARGIANIITMAITLQPIICLWLSKII